MSTTSQGPGWWHASDRLWYPPEQHPEVVATSQSPEASEAAAGAGWWLASDGKWYPPELLAPMAQTDDWTRRELNIRALLCVVLPIVGWVLAPIILATSNHFGNVSTISGLQENNNAGVIAFFITAGVEGLLGIVGIILALSARRQIRSSGGIQTGEGLTVAGLVLSAIVILGGVLAFALAVFFHSLNNLTF